MNILKLKQKWNNFVNYFKAKEVYKCQVIIVGLTRCNNLTYNKYCKEHWKLRALECSKYHFVDKAKDLCDDGSFNNIGDEFMAKSLLALVELEQRMKYRIKYYLNSDKGHEMWEEHLKEESWYFKIRSNYIIPYDTESSVNADDDLSEITEDDQDGNYETEWLNETQFYSGYLELYLDLKLPNQNNEPTHEEIWE